jgi:endoglucanase
MDLNLPLLQKLIETPGIAGREHRVRQLIEHEIAGLFDHVRVDPMGSLIAVREPRPGGGKKKTRKSDKPLKVMIASHMDQIGFMVKHIDDRGFVRVNAVGGFDTRNLFARLCVICPDVRDAGKDLLAVMNPGGKTIHIADEADKNKIPQIYDLFLDTGLPAEEVKKRVKIGDMVVIRATFDHVGQTVVGQAMDNRVACWWAIEAVRAAKHHDCEIHVAFTVQEEVGCRGAGTSSYYIEPDVAISLDITLAVDTPGVPDDQRVSKQGDGVGILAMDSSMISDLDLVEEFDAIASREKIKAQRTILPRGGNDGYAIQLKNAGRRVATLVCPTRNVHTVTEMCLLEDLRASRDLLAAYLRGA